MNLFYPGLLRARAFAPGVRFAWTVPAAMLLPVASAQVASRSPGQLEAPASARLMEQESATLARTPGSGLYLEPNGFLRYGPFTARPHFDASVSYSSGLRSREGGGESVVSHSYSPGILIELGPKWHLDYTPTLTYYSSDKFDDNLAHSVSFSGGTSYGDWAFSVSQTYSTSSQSLLETGRQTPQETFGTSLGASHYLSSKLMLQLTFNQSFRSAEELTSSRTWSTMEWLNYQVAQRVSIGAGVGGGYEDVNVGNDMTYEMVQGRVDARIAQKLNLSINAGGEIRQIRGTDVDSLVNPIYGAAIVYHPFTYTTLSLAANRTISASLLAGQLTESTDISVSLGQRLLGALSAALSASFRTMQFVSTTSGAELNRQDDSVTFAASLGYGFLKRGSIGLSYSQTENTSSEALFTTSSHQVALNLGYRF